MKINNLKSEIITFLLIFPFFEPLYFSYVENFVDKIFIFCKIISALYIILQLYSGIKERKMKISNLIIFIIFFELFRVFTSFVNNANTGNLIKQVITIISFVLICDIRIKMHPNKFLKIIINIMTVYLIINIFSYYFGIFKYQHNVFFLGFRTRFTDYAITLIILSLVEYGINKKIVKLLVRLALSITNIFMAEVSTGIMGVAFLTVYLVLAQKNSFKHIIGFFKPILFAIFINISIVFFRIQDVFSFIIEDILNKKLTFTGRTYIWDNAIAKSLDSLLIGHGYRDGGNFCEYAGKLWQAHNDILQNLYESGIVGLVLLFLIILEVGKNLNKNCDSFAYNIFVAGIFSMIIMMTMEILTIHIFIFLIFVIANNINVFKGEIKNDT